MQQLLKKLIFVILIFSLCACSTRPKNRGYIFDVRNRAETQLDLGNKQADRGNPEAALLLLDEAFRLAVSTDDPNLQIRSGLSRGNVLFFMGNETEARDCWENALKEADRSGNRELSAVCRIHIARGNLVSRGKDAAQSVRDDVNRDLALIKSDRLYTAFAWLVMGLAEKELGRYANAESAVKHSLEIHEKDLFFELAAYDWFLIASFRSHAGNYNTARQALENAINFDRRVENSWGLASDWRVLGDVHKKAGDTEAAKTAWIRAAAIYRSLGNNEAAEETLSKVQF